MQDDGRFGAGQGERGTATRPGRLRGTQNPTGNPFSERRTTGRDYDVGSERRRSLTRRRVLELAVLKCKTPRRSFNSKGLFNLQSKLCIFVVIVHAATQVLVAARAVTVMASAVHLSFALASC